MKPLAFYNEHDPRAAAWLRELIEAGRIAPGVVDERDIRQLTKDDLNGFSQIHLFGGVGGWSLALRLAGVPDGWPVWTGSAPCQPFSTAGKRRGHADERHLWPEMRRLIEECKPAIAFGEQVASKDGRGWLAGVRTDLEELGYAVGAADLSAAGVGAPHIRQRLYWVADLHGERRYRQQIRLLERQSREDCLAGGGGAGGLADAECAARGPHPARGELVANGHDVGRAQAAGEPGIHIEIGGVGNAQRLRWEAGRWTAANFADEPNHGPLQPWSDFEFIPCRDGRLRRIKPGLEPVAHGIPGRVAALRGYGNAIVPPLAAQFVRAFFEARGGRGRNHV